MSKMSMAKLDNLDMGIDDSLKALEEFNSGIGDLQIYLTETNQLMSYHFNHRSNTTMSEGIVKIHGKEYRTVGKRIADFRAIKPDHEISTEVLSTTDLVLVKATIKDPDGKVIATGHAEELRGSTNINKTSALENAETSAVGRCLAFTGMGGTEIASADEVVNAQSQIHRGRYGWQLAKVAVLPLKNVNTSRTGLRWRYEY